MRRETTKVKVKAKVKVKEEKKRCVITKLGLEV